MKTAIIGIITGFFNGLFGSGGGTIVVPAMEKFLDVDTHKAHATAIAIILPLTIISCFVYIRNVKVDFMVVLYVSIGGMIGGFLGAKYLKKLSANIVHKIFGICMIAAAVKMFF